MKAKLTISPTLPCIRRMSSAIHEKFKISCCVTIDIWNHPTDRSETFSIYLANRPDLSKHYFPSWKECLEHFNLLMDDRSIV